MVPSLYPYFVAVVCRRNAVSFFDFFKVFARRVRVVRKVRYDYLRAIVDYSALEKHTLHKHIVLDTHMAGKIAARKFDKRTVETHKACFCAVIFEKIKGFFGNSARIIKMQIPLAALLYVI